MVTLKRSDMGYYRPYLIELSTGWYFVDNIKIYNGDGIMCETHCGFFEDSIGDIKVELPIDEIKLRRKEKFDGEVFAMTHRDSYAPETRAVLYIPADMLGIKFAKYDYIKGIHHLNAIYNGEQGIQIKNFLKSANNRLEEIRGEYGEEAKKVEAYRLSINIEEVKQALRNMSSLVEQYEEELERVDNLTPEEILEQF